MPNVEITCEQNIVIRENDNLSCWCKAFRDNFFPKATWVKNGHVLGIPSSKGQQIYLHNISKEASGTYVCRAQLYTLIGEKSVEITVQCKPFFLFIRIF